MSKSEIQTCEIPAELNSFLAERKTSWFSRNRYVWLFAIVSAIQTISMYSKFDLDSKRDEYLDSIAMTVDFGDIVHKSKSSITVEIDEVFGNEFVKDKVIDPNATEDPRIGSAQDAVAGNATMPVDQNPEINPEYSHDARSAGVEGTVTLEMIVGDDGRVLRARSVGKKLGYGLEEAAISAFKKKKYSPSLQDGKPITVKFYQPVRFSLVK